MAFCRRLVPLYLLSLVTIVNSRGLSYQPVCIVNGRTKLDIAPPRTGENCIDKNQETGRFKCKSGEYIHRDCMCTYQQYYNPSGEKPKNCYGDDDSQVNFKQMTCQECKNYSVNGPCGDRGTYECEHDQQVAEDIQCKCSEGYSGKYCDYVQAQFVCRPINSTIHTCIEDSLKEGCIFESKADTSLHFVCNKDKDFDTTNWPLCADAKIEDIKNTTPDSTNTMSPKGFLSAADQLLASKIYIFLTLSSTIVVKQMV